MGQTMPDNIVPGTRSYQEGINPKDRAGATKVDITVLPPIGVVKTAFAMMDGVSKYGPFNWRVEPVQARTYIAAAQRHLLDWLDGEENAPDSMAHHLAHAAACCFILMDAQEQMKLVDDRPVQTSNGVATPHVLRALEDTIKMQRSLLSNDEDGVELPSGVYVYNSEEIEDGGDL